MNVRAKKSLGQHFLIDKNIAQKIAGSLSTENAKTVLEIGPGTGALTGFLLDKIDIDFKVIEIDTESIAYLKEKFSDLEIIHNDFLKHDIAQISDNLAIIGNFPYNISSQIFFKVLENRETVSEVVCMIQKEVAQRIASAPGNKTYGILSVLLQAFYNIEYLFTVSEHVFAPPPKVKSAVIRLKRNDVKNLDVDENLFFRVVKATFNQRRKTIRNSLKPIVGKSIADNQFLGMRPEQLAVKDFVELCRLL